MDPEEELYLPDEEDDEECDCGEDTCVCPLPGPSWELRQILADALKAPPSDHQSSASTSDGG